MPRRGAGGWFNSSNFMMLKIEECVFRIGAGMVCVTAPELPDIATKID